MILTQLLEAIQELKSGLKALLIHGFVTHYFAHVILVK